MANDDFQEGSADAPSAPAADSSVPAANHHPSTPLHERSNKGGETTGSSGVQETLDEARLSPIPPKPPAPQTTPPPPQPAVSTPPTLPRPVPSTTTTTKITTKTPPRPPPPTSATGTSSSSSGFFSRGLNSFMNRSFSSDNGSADGNATNDAGGSAPTAGSADLSASATDSATTTAAAKAAASTAPAATSTTTATTKTVASLEMDLAEANAKIKQLEQQQQQQPTAQKQQQAQQQEESQLLLQELQRNLQEQMVARAEAENRARLAEQAQQAAESTLAKQKLGLAQTTLRMATAEQKQDALQTELQTKTALCTKQHQDVAVLQAQQRKLKDRINLQAQEKTTLQGQLKSAQQEKSKLQEQIKVLEQAKTKLQEQVKNLEQDKTKLQEKLNGASSPTSVSSASLPEVSNSGNKGERQDAAGAKTVDNDVSSKPMVAGAASDLKDSGTTDKDQQQKSTVETPATSGAAEVTICEKEVQPPIATDPGTSSNQDEGQAAAMQVAPADSQQQQEQLRIEAEKKLSELQDKLEEQLQARAEVENQLRLARQDREQFEQEKKEQQGELETLLNQLLAMRQEKDAADGEVSRIRGTFEEQERKENALTFRLNTAKKREAEQANAAERFEDELQAAREELDQVKHQLEKLQTTKAGLEQTLEQTKMSNNEKVSHIELALAEERELNEERKEKMKVFVQHKLEELRLAVAAKNSLQTELHQTNQSLVDMNHRHQQQHAQWVQLQARNRQLQREMVSLKKDSEHWNKVGDSFHYKIKSAASELDEHKHKRAAAKHELMTVLSTLEQERAVTSALHDSIKFTFVPTALTQQDLLRTSVQDLELELVKLSQRIRKPLPPAPTSAASSQEEHDGLMDGSSSWNDETGQGAGHNGVPTHAAAADDSNNHQHIITKLEQESQRVTECITRLTSGIERMHILLDTSGDRSCFNALSEILSTGGTTTSSAISNGGATRRSRTAAQEETRRLGPSSSSRRVGGSSYGQIPSHE